MLTRKNPDWVRGLGGSVDATGQKIRETPAGAPRYVL